MTLTAILIFAAGTYLFRLAGPLLHDRIEISANVQRLLNRGATVLLVALLVVTTLTQAQEFAGWARPAGVAVAGVLAWRRAPFVVIVLAAAVTTALLRLAGLP